MRSRFYSLVIAALLVVVAPLELLAASRADLKERSFHLGFTPFAYDLTLEAVETTYRLTGANSDIVAHHFDGGVPWPEALAGDPYHPNVDADLDLRIGHLLPAQKVYLAVTPISFVRDGMALYWGETVNMPLPSPWDSRGLDHPDVIAAYVDHCLYMIERFQPDYMAYGIEVDLLASSNPVAYQQFVVLAAAVYPALKAEHQDLPIFLTFTIQDDNELAALRPLIEQVLPFTDMMAVSTYPFLEGWDQPLRMPRNWFSKMKALAPELPFAVAESGLIAEPLVLESLELTIPGRESWQARFVGRMLREAQRLQAEFVIWFVPVDYDLLWDRLKDQDVDEFYKLWRDCGLWDGELGPRRSLALWRQWLRRRRAELRKGIHE
ncbi:MAG: hypothetical protein EP299_01425 [Acidobacteria bacterium]|nr:MAG: hypothetical protein EP299_01425 [Acidobacteriota bacterium]